jgi:hypothetical protein
VIVLGAVVVNVPPQTGVGPEVATVMPAGRVSVKLTPVSASDVFGLFNVNVSEVVPPSSTLETPNALLTVGAAATAIIAVATLPVPPLAEVTAPVVLVFTPGVVPVTVTLNTHEPLAAIVAPLRVIVLGLVVVSVPPQIGVGPEVTTSSPAGRISVTATPVSATVELGLSIVNVRVEVPPSGMLVGLNALLITGGATTVMLAIAVLPVPPFVAVTAPVVLFFTPAVAPVTVTMI